MKRLLFSILFFSSSIAVMAQMYAYSMNGKVMLKRDTAWQEVFCTMELLETDSIITEKYGDIVILDRGEKKTYALQSPVPSTIGQLIASYGQKSPVLLVEYIEGLYNMLMGHGIPNSDIARTSGGVTYRGANEDLAIAATLVQYPDSSYYPIDFTLLDEFTMSPITSVYENRSVIAQINNHSDTPLFIDIIDQDEQSNRTALFSANTISPMDLYIPAFSSVRLSNYPIMFAPADTRDQLRLVAYPLPFDLAHVLELSAHPENIISSDATGISIGCFQIIVPILPLP